MDLVVLGDATSGKSTLVGHLIYKCGGAGKEALDQVEKDAAARGTQVRDYSLVLNPHVSQQHQHSGAVSPSTAVDENTHLVDGKNFRFAVSEVPGSSEHLKRLSASGFTTGPCSNNADAALLVVSAVPGELESGLSSEGRTREHVLLARVLGAGQIVVAVSKLDAAANAFAESRFEEARRAISEVLQSLGFRADTAFIPVSGLSGDNLTEPSPQMAWFKGPTLLQALDSLEQPKVPSDLPLRVPVREVYHLEAVGAVAAGRVEQGVLRLGAQVVFVPGNASGKVRTIEVAGATVREARPRDCVTFAVEGLGIADLRRGMVAAEAAHPATEAESFWANVTVLRGPGEVRAGFSPVLAFHAAQVPCRFEELLARLDRSTAEPIEERPAALRAGDVGLVRIRPEQPLCVEAHDVCPQLGKFATTREQTAISLVGVVCEVEVRR